MRQLRRRVKRILCFCMALVMMTTMTGISQSAYARQTNGEFFLLALKINTSQVKIRGILSIWNSVFLEDREDYSTGEEVGYYLFEPEETGIYTITSEYYSSEDAVYGMYNESGDLILTPNVLEVGEDKTSFTAIFEKDKKYYVAVGSDIDPKEDYKLSVDLVGIVSMKGKEASVPQSAASGKAFLYTPAETTEYCFNVSMNVAAGLPVSGKTGEVVVAQPTVINAELSVEGEVKAVDSGDWISTVVPLGTKQEVSDGSLSFKYDLKAGQPYYIIVTNVTDSSMETKLSIWENSSVSAISAKLAEDARPLVIGVDDGKTQGKDWIFDESAYQSLYDITIQYSDGSTRVWNCGKDGYLDDLKMIAKQPWTPGGTNILSFEYKGKTASVKDVPVRLFGETSDQVLNLELDQEKEAYYGTDYSDEVVAYFTPEEADDYYFYAAGEADTNADLYSDDGTHIAFNDDYDSINFGIVSSLEAGKQYMLRIRTYESGSGSYRVGVVKKTETISEDLTGKTINLSFVIDTTGSMQWVINKVQDNLVKFVDLLADTGANLRIALVDYKDIVEDAAGYATTVVHISPNGTVWYENGDKETLKDDISKLIAMDGGDGPETVIDALGFLTDGETINYNSKGTKFAFVVTDADYKVDNRHGIASMDEMISKLKEKGIVTSVICPKRYYVDESTEWTDYSSYGGTAACYKNLVDETSGKWFDIESDFADTLFIYARDIARVTKETVDSGSTALTSIDI